MHKVTNINGKIIEDLEIKIEIGRTATRRLHSTDLNINLMQEMKKYYPVFRKSDFEDLSKICLCSLIKHPMSTILFILELWLQRVHEF